MTFFRTSAFSRNQRRASTAVSGLAAAAVLSTITASCSEGGSGKAASSAAATAASVGSHASSAEATEARRERRPDPARARTTPAARGLLGLTQRYLVLLLGPVPSRLESEGGAGSCGGESWADTWAATGEEVLLGWNEAEIGRREGGERHRGREAMGCCRAPRGVEWIGDGGVGSGQEADE
nr:unnamed protein product [Digitaria exilis]